MNASRSTLRNRTYPRRFDWDEARKRVNAGESIKEVAQSLGVSPTAIRRVVVQSTYDQMRAYTTEWMKRGTCNKCGATCSRTYLAETHTCRDCAEGAKVKRRGNALYCPACRKWLPDNDFSPAPSLRYRRLARTCRSCNNRLRRERRMRRRMAEGYAEMGSELLAFSRASLGAAFEALPPQ